MDEMWEPCIDCLVMGVAASLQKSGLDQTIRQKGA